MTDARPWTMLANHTQNGWRAVGGRLSVRERTLVFEPNAFDALLWGQRLEIPFDEIAGFSRCEPSFSVGNLFSGGLVLRLSVDRKTGPPERFVVSKVDAVIAELTELTR